VKQVTDALNLKLSKFRSGTDALVIFGSMFVVEPIWKSRVLEILRAVMPMPYKHVFVGDQQGIAVIYHRDPINDLQPRIQTSVD